MSLRAYILNYSTVSKPWTTLSHRVDMGYYFVAAAAISLAHIVPAQINARMNNIAVAARKMLQFLLDCGTSRFSQMIFDGSEASNTSCSSPKSISPWPAGLKTG